MKKTVLFIVGPTASGKSSVALKLSELLPIEIISADSMQVYRGMDVGTAKPSNAEIKAVPHHLIDKVDPSEKFSAHDFREAALSAIEGIFARKRLPVVVGGSGLYLRALIDGFSAQPGSAPETREALEERAETSGLENLYLELKNEDPDLAAKIKPTDKRRIVRALEIIQISGKKPTEWYESRISLAASGYDFILTGLRRNRAELYAMINSRVDEMFENGLLNETRRLYQCPLSDTAKQAVGYKEVFNYYKSYGVREPTTNEKIELKKKIQQNTRHLAKRQLTWFRRDERIRWIDVSSPETLNQAAKHIASFL